MQGHCILSKVWELCSDSLQLLLGKRSSKDVLVGDMGSDILLGTEFSCLTFGDESTGEFLGEDTPWGSQVIDVDIGHERDEFTSEGCGRMGLRRNGGLSCISPVYMCF